MAPFSTPLIIGILVLSSLGNALLQENCERCGPGQVLCQDTVVDVAGNRKCCPVADGAHALCDPGQVCGATGCCLPSSPEAGLPFNPTNPEKPAESPPGNMLPGDQPPPDGNTSPPPGTSPGNPPPPGGQPPEGNPPPPPGTSPDNPPPPGGQPPPEGNPPPPPGTTLPPSEEQPPPEGNPSPSPGTSPDNPPPPGGQPPEGNPSPPPGTSPGNPPPPGGQPPEGNPPPPPGTSPDNPPPPGGQPPPEGNPSLPPGETPPPDDDEHDDDGIPILPIPLPLPNPNPPSGGGPDPPGGGPDPPGGGPDPPGGGPDPPGGGPDPPGGGPDPPGGGPDPPGGGPDPPGGGPDPPGGGPDPPGGGPDPPGGPVPPPGPTPPPTPPSGGDPEPTDCTEPSVVTTFFESCTSTSGGTKSCTTTSSDFETGCDVTGTTITTTKTGEGCPAPTADPIGDQDVGTGSTHKVACPNKDDENFPFCDDEKCQGVSVSGVAFCLPVDHEKGAKSDLIVCPCSPSQFTLILDPETGEESDCANAKFSKCDEDKCKGTWDPGAIDHVVCQAEETRGCLCEPCPDRLDCADEQCKGGQAPGKQDGWTECQDGKYKGCVCNVKQAAVPKDQCPADLSCSNADCKGQSSPDDPQRLKGHCDKDKKYQDCECKMGWVVTPPLESEVVCGEGQKSRAEGAVDEAVRSAASEACKVFPESMKPGNQAWEGAQDGKAGDKTFSYKFHLSWSEADSCKENASPQDPRVPNHDGAENFCVDIYYDSIYKGCEEKNLGWGGLLKRGCLEYRLDVSPGEVKPEQPPENEKPVDDPPPVPRPILLLY